MIVKMKKLTLLCTASQQEETLKKLRDLQVVHIKHVRAPEGSELEQARNHLLYVQRAKEVLQARPDADPTGKDPHHLVDTVWKLIHKEKELKESLQALEHEHERIQPFGDFEPREIEKLNEQGLFVKLYELPVKNPPEIPDGVAIKEISTDKNIIYALAVGRSEFSIPAHEVRLPDRSLTRIEHHIEKTKAELEETEAEFQKYAGDKHLAEQIVSEAQDGVTFLEVRDGMGKESLVTYLSGFYPVDREADIVSAAEANGWGYTFDDTTGEDNPPTLLRNPKFLNPIKPVFKMIGVLPGYKEIDISFLFLLFLSIFFAFLIGDAGYGALFIGFSLFAKTKLKNNEAAKPALSLIMIMSSATVIWGVLNGTYFGIDFDVLPSALKNISSSWLIAGGDEEIARNRVMFICFSIGAVHLTIAHVWGFIRKINSPACLCDLGWLCSTWALYFVVLHLVLGMVQLNMIIGIVLIIGVVLVAAGLVLAKEISGLITLVLDVISNFVDIISYVRLYAVGAASLAIAQSFNQMGMDAGNAMPPVIGHLIAALIIFFGHALNILLGAMGVLVHGIRLNTLEFSGHAGVQWGGTEYKPFRKIN
ncbi:MAG: hypothetical protein JXR40_13750 [Pontiellaceae bacterium]|nr:hypothetical protein [Pontiellaceae bacterium]